MPETEQLQRKIESVIDEDTIIKNIMLEYPDIYDMLGFNEFNLKDKLEKNAYWYQNFRLLMVSEKRKLNHITMLHDEYVGNLYHKLRFENNISISKVEVERFYIPKDDKVMNFKRLILKQQVRVETFDAIKDAFRQQGFNMTQFIKNMEL